MMAHGREVSAEREKHYYFAALYYCMYSLMMYVLWMDGQLCLCCFALRKDGSFSHFDACIAPIKTHYAMYGFNEPRGGMDDCGRSRQLIMSTRTIFSE